MRCQFSLLLQGSEKADVYKAFSYLLCPPPPLPSYLLALPVSFSIPGKLGVKSGNSQQVSYNLQLQCQHILVHAQLTLPLHSATEGCVWVATRSFCPPRDLYSIQMSSVLGTRKTLPLFPHTEPVRLEELAIPGDWSHQHCSNSGKFSVSQLFWSTSTRGKANKSKHMKMVWGWFYSSGHELSWTIHTSLWALTHNFEIHWH